MAEDEQKKVTFRVPESLHKPARIKLAEFDGTFQELLTELLTKWVRGEGISSSDLSEDERRLVGEFRAGSLEKRRRILAAVYRLDEPVGPEVMPTPVAKPKQADHPHVREIQPHKTKGR